MKEKEYGDKFKDHLLDQYKLYVEMADNISNRRGQANMFFISVLSGLFAILSIVVKSNVNDLQNVVFLAAGILGIAICSVWFITIQLYRQLSSAKFDIIHIMERQLPFCCYDEEWKILKEKKYLELTKVERYVPVILVIPYLILLVFSIYLTIC